MNYTLSRARVNILAVFAALVFCGGFASDARASEASRIHQNILLFKGIIPLPHFDSSDMKEGAFLPYPFLSERRFKGTRFRTPPLSVATAREFRSSLRVRPSVSAAGFRATDVATGANAELYTDFGPGMSLEWEGDFGLPLSVFAQAEVSRFKILPPPKKNIADPVMDVFSAGAGLRYGRFHRLVLSLMAGVEEGTTFSATDASTLTFDQSLTPWAGGGVHFDLAKIQGFSVANTLQAKALLPPLRNNSGHRLGASFRGNIEVSRVVRKWELFCEIYFQVRSQSSAVLIQQRTDLGMSLGLGWRFMP